MMIARVKGSVVTSLKHRDYERKNVFVIQPLDPELNPVGNTMLAVDGVKAGVGDIVLIIDEGGSAKMVLKDSNLSAIRSVIAGIIDSVDREI
jgi:microcompartment protein CcmK/EutM